MFLIISYLANTILILPKLTSPHCSFKRLITRKVPKIVNFEKLILSKRSYEVEFLEYLMSASLSDTQEALLAKVRHLDKAKENPGLNAELIDNCKAYIRACTTKAQAELLTSRLGEEDLNLPLLICVEEALKAREASINQPFPSLVSEELVLASTKWKPMVPPDGIKDAKGNFFSADQLSTMENDFYRNMIMEQLSIKNKGIAPKPADVKRDKTLIEAYLNMAHSKKDIDPLIQFMGKNKSYPELNQLVRNLVVAANSQDKENINLSAAPSPKDNAQKRVRGKAILGNRQNARTEIMSMLNSSKKPSPPVDKNQKPDSDPRRATGKNRKR